MEREKSLHGVYVVSTCACLCALGTVASKRVSVDTLGDERVVLFRANIQCLRAGRYTTV